MIKKVTGFLEEVKIEFKKVVWSGKRDVTSATISVLALVVFVSVLLSILDYLLSLGLKSIFM